MLTYMTVPLGALHRKNWLTACEGAVDARDSYLRDNRYLAAEDSLVDDFFRLRRHPFGSHTLEGFYPTKANNISART